MQNSVHLLTKQEFSNHFQVFDVGDVLSFEECSQHPETKLGFMFSYGGLIGEIIVVFSAISDYIQS